MGIKTVNLNKQIESSHTKILSDINLEILEGEMISLTGKSGSGKSSLLYLLSTLDNSSGGTIIIDGKEISKMTKKEILHFRNKKAGFIFQFHYLISELTIMENVLLPSAKEGSQKEKKEYGLYLLETLGLKDKIKRLPRQLSGGEAQRTAIARALIMQPKYIFADEPTGSLDSVNGKQIMDLLQKVNKEFNTTIILVTHDLDFAKMTGRQIYLRDGQIVSSAQ
jgi:ABC-type lipoprotein export system ATPase subunit